MLMPLIATDLLDPREAALAAASPIAGAVNLPVARLAGASHELPPREVAIRICDVGDAARAAVNILQIAHRVARNEPKFSCLPAEQSVCRYRLWRPNPWLEQQVAALSPGRAIDLACGNGRDAVHLASIGWDVLGVDLLPDALELAKALRDRYAPEAAARFEVLDLEVENAMPPGRFELVCGFRYLHRPLLRRAAEWLTAGGHLIWETFTTLHRERHRKPSRDAHLLQPGELPTLLAGLKIVQYEEGWRGDSHTARIVARRE